MKALITLALTGLLFSAIYGQENQTRATGYFSGYVGGGLLADDGGLILGYGISGGYQWNKYLGMGVGLTGNLGLNYFFSGFNGVSLQYRIKPGQRWNLALDYGFILNHFQGNDVLYWEYIPDWYSFFKIHLGWKPKNGFNIGLGFVGLPKVNYEECNNYDSPPGSCEPINIKTRRWNSSGVFLSLGYNWN
jgi:hypothetical protein